MSTITEPLGAVKYDRAGLIRCRVCGCTEVKPCEPPCSWHFPDLCDSCARAVSAIVEWWNGAHRPSWAALKREVDLQQMLASVQQSEETFEECYPGGVAEFRRIQAGGSTE